MKDRTAHKAGVRSGIDAARRAGLTLKTIAAEAGVEYQLVKQFCSSGALGAAHVAALDTWLRDQRFLDDTQTTSVLYYNDDPLRQTAALLRALAALLENPAFPPSDRLAMARETQALVNLSISSLEKTITARPLRPKPPA